MDIDRVINIVRSLKEEAPTMNLGAGQMAGTVEAGDDPPVNKKRPPILARGRMSGSRKRWKQPKK